MTTNYPSLPQIRALALSLGNVEKEKELLAEYWQQLFKNKQVFSFKESKIFYRHETWDSKIFGLKLIKIEQVLGSNRQKIALTLKRFLKTVKADYYLWRLPQLQHVWVQELEKAGAIFLDSNIDLSLNLGDFQYDDNFKNLTISNAQETDFKEIIKMSNSFAFGRFFTDPNLQKGNLVYENWIRNCLLKKAADESFVLKIEGQIHGFISLSYVKEAGLIFLKIPLVAKVYGSNEKAVSARLLNFALQRAVRKKVDAALINTQGANLAALRSYIGIGFKPYNNSLTLRIMPKV